MRVVWKDSLDKKMLIYRDIAVTRYGDGWIIDLPGDNNIYSPRDCALNAIDKILGGKTRKANPQRHSLGIQVIGMKDGDLSCG